MSARTPIRPWHQQIQLFAADPSDPRARRPVDALRAVASLILLGLAAFSAEVNGRARRDLTAWLADLPALLDALWVVAFWAAIAWAIALVVITALRQRPLVAVEAAAAAVIALAFGMGLAALVSDQTSDVLTRLSDTQGPAMFPPGVLAVTCAVMAAMAPHVTLPIRRLGRVLVFLQLLAVILLGVGEVDGTVASVAIGFLSAALIHLVRGSPAGFPSLERIRTALAGLGVELVDLAAVSMRPEGAVILTGTDRAGPVRIKVYGRDAWEGELLATMWRHAWYRGSQRSARISLGEFIEHEGFLTYLAAKAGARVPQIITAGLAENGDALLVGRPDGIVLSEARTSSLTPAQVSSLWQDLGSLHTGGIAHHRIDLDRVAMRSDDTAGFADLSSARVGRLDADVAADRAQLLALTIVTAGRAVAIERARGAVGDDGLSHLLPYLQEAVLPPDVRAALGHQKIKLDTVRSEIAKDAGAGDVELAPVRRVTWKSLLTYAMFAVAAYTLIGTISGLDLASFVDSLKDASWWWLFAALLLAQLPRAANALSNLGATTASIPLAPATALQFAKTYVSLAVPSSAGQIAVTTRFYQRFGVPPAAALAAGVIDSISEVIVQLVLFVAIFSISDVDVGMSLSPEQLRGLIVTVVVILAVLAVATVSVLVVPPLRRRLMEPLQQVRDAGQVLRSPTKLLQLYGGNILAQVLFACALWACVHAFGEDVSLGTLVLVNTVVSLFAGLIPVPGGVGVSEAGLALGLTKAGGISSELALAIALTYRFVSSYLPPIWGFMSFRWLTDRRYL